MKKIILKITSMLLLCSCLIFGGSVFSTPNAYAVPVAPDDLEDIVENPEENQPTEDTDKTDNTEEQAIQDQPNICTKEAGSVSWIMCPIMNTVSGFVDKVYGFIEKILYVKPATMDQSMPVYQIWQKARDITNIIFIIFMLIVIYSQITGLGIDNYGIKRALPRLIIAVILVNLSYLISSILVDISNIIGSGISDAFDSIRVSIQVPNDPLADVSWGQFFAYLTGGSATIWGIVVAASGAGNLLWMIGLALLGAAISVLIGVLTISLRQGVVLILIMISPLAFVAYLLPNTEKWFERWKNLLGQMLVFYPMFSFLYAASKLAGWAIIHSAGDSLFIVILGMLVQVMPLFMTVSLLKMSNTVLGSISSGLEKLSSPARNALGTWGDSHRINSQAKYRSRQGVSGYLTGSNLRRYLEKRQANRLFEAEQLDKGNQGLIAAYVANRANSFSGYDKNGNPIYKKRPNFTTRAAKRAANNQLLAQLADEQFKNTLGEYDKIFKNRASQELNAIGGKAFVGLYGQKLRAENIATNDQNQLLNKYIDAYKEGSGYNYNRLIRSASISMGHVGESSLIGQVLMRSVEIEGRRRTEAKVIGNKFNFPKLEYRAMVLDMDMTDDTGREINRETGEYIEDDQYRHIEGKPEHVQWQKYIGVHKKTGIEISKEQYDALSTEEKGNYNRVRYCEIPDDDTKTVQKIFFDDPGYMKEYLTRDIIVADPIVQRYTASIGLNRETGEGGPLRKYHSTIQAGVLDSRYKEHNGAMTAMYAAQSNLGYIQNMTHSNIGQLQSISASGQPGSMLMNDAYVFDALTGMLLSVENPELFDHYFKEDELESYQGINGDKLEGLRIDMDNEGHPIWKPVKANDPSLTNEERKNYIKHAIIPKTASRLFSMLDKITPNVLDKQKEGTVKSLINFVDTLGKVGLRNFDPNIGFEQRLNPDKNVFETPDVASIKLKAARLRQMSQAALDRKLAARAAAQATADSTAADFSSIFQINQGLDNQQRYRDAQNAAADISRITTEMQTVFDTMHNYDDIATTIHDRFSENSILKSYEDDLERIITFNKYNTPTNPLGNPEEETTRRIDSLQNDIAQLLNQINGSTNGINGF